MKKVYKKVFKKGAVATELHEVMMTYVIHKWMFFYIIKTHATIEEDLVKFNINPLPNAKICIHHTKNIFTTLV